MPRGLGSQFSTHFGGLHGLGLFFGIDFVFGTDGVDAIYGDGEGPILAGTVMGDDVLFGFDDDDLIVGDAGGPIVSPGETPSAAPATCAGDDVIYGGGGDDVIYGDFQADSSSLYEVHLGDDVIYGGDGNDTIYTDAVGVLADRPGNNLAYGGCGDDWIRGGEGIDLLFGGSGDDVIYADGQTGTAPGATPTSNLVDGGCGDDRLFGGAGYDAIYGGHGDDTLSGEGGCDVLSGGCGADQFAFFMGDGHDRILDFAPGEDQLVLVRDFNAPLPASDFEGIMALSVDLGCDLLIDLGDGNSVTLAGIEACELSASDFLIVA